MQAHNENKIYIGLDIGTTTISAVVRSGGQVIKSFTLPTDAALPGEAGLQDVGIILSKADEILEQIRDQFPAICGIGLTGQMHGIVYVDREGRAISPLYTWQNPYGDKTDAQGMSLCGRITALTGEHCATGYGLVTDCYLRENHLIPSGAAGFCTIMDYMGMHLTGRKTPLIHASNTASFGFFDKKESAFRTDLLKKLGADLSLLPKIGKDGECLGYWNKIPVVLAIGDNQASFLGSVGDDPGTVLINIGTGSQISLVCDRPDEDFPSGEIRPYIDGKYLKCCSALCGGAAYALVEKFFRRFYTFCTGEDREIYDILTRMMEHYTPNNPPAVETTFKGTRTDPGKTGSISGIRADNFTPEDLIFGTLCGIADELHTAFLQMRRADVPYRFTASGNGVRKNPLLVSILERKFGDRMTIPQNPEEAAAGAAIYAQKYIE